MNDLVMVTGGKGQVATALKKLDSDLRYVFCGHDELDISNPQAVRDYFEEIQPGLVINTAAYTAVDEAEENPERAYRVNKFGPELLAIACAKSKAPLIHLSTDYVFSGESDTPYTENANVCPLGLYGQTKLDGEERVRGLLGAHVILRLSGIFSDHADCFPRSILRAALKSCELKVVSDQTTGPTSAKSVASVLDLMVRKAMAGNLNWGTYHFSEQPFVSWYEFAQLIIQIAQNTDDRFDKIKIKPVTTEEFSARAPRPNYACLDSSKLAKELSLDRPILSRKANLEEAIRQIIQQF